MKEVAHIVNFSGGRSSGMMLDILLKQHPEIPFIIVFCNTSKETKETYRFLQRCEDHFKISIVVLEWRPVGVHITNVKDCKKAGEIFEEALAHRRWEFIPNVAFRWCTDYFKRRCTNRFIRLMEFKQIIQYMGIRFDEPQRYAKGMSHNTKRIYNDYPLYYQHIIKSMVNAFWASMPFDLEHDSLFGNCDLCFLKGKAKKVKIIRERPETAKWWSDMEKRTGHTFHKNFSVEDLITLAAQPEFDFGPEEQEIICNCQGD